MTLSPANQAPSRYRKPVTGPLRSPTAIRIGTAVVSSAMRIPRCIKRVSMASKLNVLGPRGPRWSWLKSFANDVPHGEVLSLPGHKLPDSWLSSICLIRSPMVAELSFC